MDCTPPAFKLFISFNCLINSICWIAFRSTTIFFFISNQLLLLCNDIWCIHNPTHILWYNRSLDPLLTLLFLCVILCQNWWACSKNFFDYWWRYNSSWYSLIDNTFWLHNVLHYYSDLSKAKQTICQLWQSLIQENVFTHLPLLYSFKYTDLLNP